MSLPHSRLVYCPAPPLRYDYPEIPPLPLPFPSLLCLQLSVTSGSFETAAFSGFNPPPQTAYTLHSFDDPVGKTPPDQGNTTQRNCCCPSTPTQARSFCLEISLQLKTMQYSLARRFSHLQLKPRPSPCNVCKRLIEISTSRPRTIGIAPGGPAELDTRHANTSSWRNAKLKHQARPAPLDP